VCTFTFTFIRLNPAKIQCATFGGLARYTHIIDSKCLSWCTKLKYIERVFKCGSVKLMSLL